MELDIVDGHGDGRITMGRLKFGAVLSAAEFAAGRTLINRQSRARRPYCGALGPASVLGGAGGVPSPTIP